MYFIFPIFVIVCWLSQTHLHCAKFMSLVFFYLSAGKVRCNVNLGEKMLLQTTGSPWMLYGWFILEINHHVVINFQVHCCQQRDYGQKQKRMTGTLNNSSLSFTTAIQIWNISYILHNTNFDWIRIGSLGESFINLFPVMQVFQITWWKRTASEPRGSSLFCNKTTKKSNNRVLKHLS